MKEPANKNLKLPIYLDYQATTPLDPHVLEVMIPYFTDKFGNPHSRSHAYGWEAEDAVEKARGQVADVIGARATEIIFTSGATESNNLALKGVAEAYKGKRNHIITLKTEHKCVLETCRYLEERGYDVSYLDVAANGLVNLDDLKDSITEKTLIMSIMAVNNEIGVIQPIKDIGELCHNNGVFFHTDAAQAFGKIPLDVDSMHIDLMSISGHKIYGPKGIGALYVRRRPRVRLTPQMSGGGQERGLRSGTLAPALIVGLGAAAYIAMQDMKQENSRIADLRDKLHDGITKQLQGVIVNSDLSHCIAGNLNLSFEGIGSDSLLVALHDLAISSGSACTSASVESSHVLAALGQQSSLAQASIRFGIGRFTTEEEIDYTIQLVVKTVNELRQAKDSYENHV